MAVFAVFFVFFVSGGVSKVGVFLFSFKLVLS